MSIKTLRKRIALVAVAALAITGLSTVSANAAVTDDTYFVADASDSTVYATNTLTYFDSDEAVATISGADGQNAKISAVVGKFVSLKWTSPAGITTTEAELKSTGAGKLFGLITQADTYTSNDGLADSVAAGGLLEALDGADVVEFKATSSTAGSQVISLIPQGGDMLTSTLTISWVSASAAELNDANTTVYAAMACNGADGDSRGTILADKAADEVTTSASDDPVHICVDPRNGAGNQVDADDVSIIGSLGGGTGDAAPATSYLDIAQAAPTTAGKATYTVLITLDDVLVSKTVTVTYFSTAKTIALGNATFSALADGDTTYTGGSVLTSIATGADGDIGMPDSADGALVLVGKDANGNLVDMSAETITFTVDSDKVSGAASAETNDSLGASVVMSAESAVGGYRADFAELGGSPIRVTCGASPEKLTITAHGYTSAGAAIASNPVTFYCADAVDKVEVTVAANAVNVKVTDENGYPVADGTAVTLAASNGSVVTPTSKTTSNGAFSKTALFVPTASASSSAVTALVGTKSGSSASVAGTGGSGNVEAQIASLVAAIAKLQKAIAKINKRLKK